MVIQCVLFFIAPKLRYDVLPHFNSLGLIFKNADLFKIRKHANNPVLSRNCLDFM